MPLPPAHFLVGAAAAEAVRPRGWAPWRLWLAGGLLAVLPDLDLVVGELMGRGRDFHGVFSHTLVAVVLVTAVAGWWGGTRWAIVAGAAYGSHLILDLLQDRGTTSVQFLWPLSSQSAEAFYPLFPTVSFGRSQGYWEGVVALFGPDRLEGFLIQTGMALGVFLAVVLVRRWVVG